MSKIEDKQNKLISLFDKILTKHLSKVEKEQQQIINLAKQLYEQARETVQGRPHWDKLDDNDPYDCGMKEYAIKLAKSQITEDKTNQ